MSRPATHLIHRAVHVFAFLGIVSAVACSSTENAASTENAIISGQLDTTHDAVVMLQIDKGDGTGAICSGTIIKTDPANKIGWVLTAAHCVSGAQRLFVLSADDVGTSEVRTFEVLDFKAHPNYPPDSTSISPYDVGMVRILGVDEHTPVIPLLTPDNLAVGTPVLSVGFGRTNAGTGPDTAPNKQRRSLRGSVRRVSPGDISVEYPTGSICHGDSGGPLLVQSGGREYVVGVHSFVVGNCIGYAGSARPASLMGFIGQNLAAPAPPVSCAVCKQTSNSGDQKCATAFHACLADQNCSGFYHCYVQCHDATCASACRTQFPLGIGPFNALRNCPCNECASACTGDSTCANVPKCGIAVGQSACGTCLEGGCCNEMAACANDPTCFACLSGSAPASLDCANNALRKAIVTCRTNNCATACAPPPDAGAPPATVTSSTP